VGKISGVGSGADVGVMVVVGKGVVGTTAVLAGVMTAVTSGCPAARLNTQTAARSSAPTNNREMKMRRPDIRWFC
jgi:hypothetical protein